MPTPRDKPLATDLARTLAQKLRDGQLVLFAGAGLSHLALAKDGSDRRIPLWDGLTEAVSGRFGFDIQDFSNSPLDLFDAVTHAHSRGELETAVRETLDDRDFELSPAHHALAELPWHSVITTNYDGLLSRPFSQEKDPWPIANEADFDRLHDAKVIQIHGNLLHPHTLTRDDYRLWADKNPRAAHALAGFMLNATLLFVGYSFNDPHLEEILAWVRKSTQGREKRLYGLFWKIPEAQQSLLDGRDKISAAAIHTAGEWENAFRQIKAELDQLNAGGSPTSAKSPDDGFAYDRAQYSQALGARYGVANLQGLYIWGAGYARDDVTLQEIFVEPDLRDRSKETPDPGPDAPEDSEYRREIRRQERLLEQTTGREPALAMLGRENRLCVIGAPGQGKSTLLHHYLLKSAEAWRHSPKQQPFPIYLRLNAWEQQTGTANIGFVAWAKQAIAGMGEFGSQALDAWIKGQVLWLLDGVDEIRDPYQRQALQDELLTLFKSRPQDRAILATRPQGYPSGGFGTAWRAVELPPLNPQQGRQVLANWGEVLKRKEGNLFFNPDVVDRELNRQSGLRQIRGNALLLTLAVLFYKNNRRLPNDRWEFFDKAESALRDSWLAYRMPEKAHKDLPGDYLPVFLERLALHGMKQGIVIFPADTLKSEARKLFYERGYTGAEGDREIQRLLRAADDLIGVIAAQGPDRYGFLHLSFQEFLAARALVNRSDWCADVIADYWDEPDWAEVWSFYAKGIREDMTRWRGLFSSIQTHTHVLDQYLHRDKLACLRLGGFCLGALPEEWDALEAWALQALVADFRFYATLWERERPLSSDLLEALLVPREGMYSHRAAEVLSRHSDAPEVRATLLARLGNGESEAREAAAWALTGQAGDPEVRSMMLTSLGDNNPNVRDIVARGLARQAGDLEVRAALLARLGDGVSDVQRSVVHALAGHANDPEVQAVLLAMLKHRDAAVRAAVAGALYERSDEPEVRAALVARMKDRNSAVRVKAIWALSEQTSEAEVRAALLAKLGDRNSSVRRAAAGAMFEQVENPEVQAALLVRLSDRVSAVREAAAGALYGQAGNPEVRVALLALLKDQNAAVRQAAVWTLDEQASDREIWAVLLTLLGDPSPEVKEAAAGVLTSQAVDSEIRAALVERLRDRDSAVRGTAAWALVGQAGEPEVRAALLERLVDEDSGVQRSAAQALSRHACDPEIQATILTWLAEGHLDSTIARGLSRAVLHDRRRQRQNRLNNPDPAARNL